ncbi:hypothetical protein [Deinococcus rubellus]
MIFAALCFYLGVCAIQLADEAYALWLRRPVAAAQPNSASIKPLRARVEA